MGALELLGIIVYFCVAIWAGWDTIGRAADYPIRWALIIVLWPLALLLGYCVLCVGRWKDWGAIDDR